MGILVSCECGKTFKVPEKFAGKKGKCAGCGKILEIPIPVGHGQADEPVIGFAPEAASVPPPPPAPVRQPVSAGPSRQAATPQARTPGLPAVPPPPPPPPAEAPVEDDGLYDLAPPDVPPPPVARPVPVTPAARSAAGAKGKAKGVARPAGAVGAPVVGGFVPPPTVVIEYESSESEGRKSWRDYFYLVLLVALLPLAIYIFSKEVSFDERLKRTVQQIAKADGQPESAESGATEEAPPAPTPAESAVESEEAAGSDDEEEEEEGASEGLTMDEVDAILKSFPDRRLYGALLARDSSAHWLIALGSALAFFVLLLLLFQRERIKAHWLIVAGVFTGTIGILFLLLVQLAAFARFRVWRMRGKAAIVILLLLFIRFSYMAALHPDTNFVLSFLGFTFGVGMCEELVKAIPLIWLARREESPGWRGFMLLGLASGVGFGVSEGITYSSSFYNGIHSMDMYMVRFVSCVALHAIWSASVAIAIHRRQDLVGEQDNWGNVMFGALLLIGVPMVLHGLYDTFLKKDMSVMALVTALVSFGFLAFQIEMRRKDERAEDDGHSAARPAFA